ncbi:MAG: MBL fold metallo-hydrolase [Halodesulfurarchaeum sp.]
MIRRVELPIADRVPSGGTNAYLLGEPTVLVDPASEAVLQRVDDARIDHVAVTHTHTDHVGGMETVAKSTGATIWARMGQADRFERETGVEPDRTFTEGDELGESGVRVIDAPGHAPDHVVFHRADALLVGDVARADGSVMVGTPDGDMRAYLITLRRLRQAEVTRAYPGHGPPIEDPESRFTELLAHRRRRERRIERAVNDGARTVESIIEAAYEKDLRGLEDLAERTVRAHLEKLAVEGRLRWDGTVAHPI